MARHAGWRLLVLPIAILLLDCDGTSYGCDDVVPSGPEVFSCEGTRMDCDGDAENGCETDTAQNGDHCGACGNACGPTTVGSATCKAGKCVYSSCSTEGFADCDGDGRACEARLADDPENCGACGNDCGDYECAEGACVPVVVVDRQAVVSAFGLTADGVVWIGSGGVFSVGKDGDGLVPLDSTAVGDGLVLDATSAYGTAREAGRVFRVPLSGGPATILDDTTYPTEPAVDDTHLYWLDFNAVVRTPKDAAGTGQVETIATAPMEVVSGLALDDAFAYFAARLGPSSDQGYEIRRVPKAGGPIEVIAGSSVDSTASSLVVHGDQVFWAVASPVPEVVMRAPITGGAATTLYEAATLLASPLVFRGEDLFVNDGGDLVRIDVATGDSAVVATTLVGADLVAIDATTAFYASSSTTTIWRIGT